MSGLCDVTTGLQEGTGLQFQTQIGTAGLDITIGGAPALAILASDSAIILASDASYIVTAS